ncbi:patatin-like phospholipase domain-containing protein 1 [Alligator mississippiensis]|uniref:Large ribosomal subunit protein P2 n=1 Tax=Alligator mississippiensis TaxID=8496 RepID=A0A151N9F0_ALLMI|nr:patatin-like phospholipase domain-containing protein 1 [Alligator mississippiensis]
MPMNADWESLASDKRATRFASAPGLKMRYVAAYLLAVLGGNDSPTAKNIKKILSSVGIDADDERVDKVISELSGKDVDDVINSGLSKLTCVPAGGAVAAAPAAPAGGGAAPAEIVDEFYYAVMEKNKKSLLGPFSSGSNFFKLLEKGLYKSLKENCHQLASGRLHIGLTRLPDGQKVVISDFCSKEEVIQAVLCSCFIPCLCGWIPPSFRGVDIREIYEQGYRDTVFYLQINKEHGTVTRTSKKTSHGQLQHRLPEIVDEIYSEVMEKSKKSIFGPYSPRFHFLKLLEKGLRKGLTENCHQLASGRLHIGLTRLPDGQKVVISDFCSKEEVIQAVLCSCFIPVIWGWIPPSFRGVNHESEHVNSTADLREKLREEQNEDTSDTCALHQRVA